MNALNEYTSNVDASLKNIASHSEENKYRACVVLQNAGFYAPIISKSDKGVSVCIRSPVAKKTVIVSIKKVSPCGWADMPLSVRLATMAEGLANDDFETFSSNMRTQWVDGKRVIPETPVPIELAWRDAFNASQDFPEAVDDKQKIGVFHRRAWITLAWSTAMYRMFSEVLLGAMDDADQEGLGILLGSRSRVMYLHAQENIRTTEFIYKNTIETRVAVMDM
jgi:hypothetical protein